MQTMTSKGTAPTSAALGSAVPTSTVLDNAVLNSAVLNPAGLGTTGVEVLGTHAAHLAALASAAEDHEDRALSENTRRAYTHDWAQWVAWCSMFGAEPLPADPEMVRLYVTELASVQDQHGLPRFRAVTIGRAVSAISHFNAAAGFEGRLGHHPRVAPVLRGIRRLRQEPSQPKEALLLNDVCRLIAAMDHDLWPAGVGAARDTLALWLGFAGALRRSNVAALKVGDIRLDPHDGLHVRLQRSKTDQEGAGAVVAIPYGTNPLTCAPCAWMRWMQVHAQTSGARSARMGLVLRTGQPNDWTHVCRGPQPVIGKPDGSDPQVIDPERPLLVPVDRHGDITVRVLDGAALNAALGRRLSARTVGGSKVAMWSASASSHSA